MLLRLCDVDCESFTVAWEPPFENGGVDIEAFEVQLTCPEERYTVLLGGEARRQSFSGFEAGSGPHLLQVG